MVITFHLEHYWSEGFAALGFGRDQIRTLVSMATDNSHKVIMVTTLAPSFLIGSSLFLQVTRTTIKSRMTSNLGRIRQGTHELAAIERLGKIPIDL